MKLSLIFLFTTVQAQSPPLWGFAASAIQIEGSWNVSRGPSVWDTFQAPAGYGNATIAADHYRRYKDDIALMGSFKASAYRFSFSWPRIFPSCSGTPNEEGLKYYSDLIDALLRQGIEPIGTIYHWDLPAKCQEEYGGWTNKRIVQDFTAYALLLADRFSDRIRYWLTVNEPSPICYYAYSNGAFAPGVKMGPKGEYLCAYHSILAHGSAVKAIKSKYPERRLKFSLPVVMGWAIPLNENRPEDVAAALRTLEYSGGWYLDAIVRGDYPESMRADPVVTEFLVPFTDEEKTMIRGSCDFIAVNYYTSSYVYYEPTPGTKGNFQFTSVKNNVPIGPKSGIDWQLVYPAGLRSLVGWLSKRYSGLDVWVTEIGCAGPEEDVKTRDEIIDNSFCTDFMTSHTASLMEAVEQDKIPIKAFLVWSFLDNWEWQFGYKPRFGMVGVDYNNGTLDRFPKKSASALTAYFTKSSYWNQPNTVANPVSLPDGTGNGSSGDTKKAKNGVQSVTAILGLLLSLSMTFIL